MTALALAPRPACPIRTGDRVHVPEPVEMPSGRLVPPGHYDADAVEVAPDGRWTVSVTYRPDCSALGARFQRPTREQLRAGAPVPLCAQPATARLGPGQVTRYANGEGPATIPDRPALAHG